MQQTATKTLIQVAASCSTEEGCDPVSTEELNCLLCGLQSYYPGVRAACMKVSIQFIASIETFLILEFDEVVIRPFQGLEVMISAFPTAKKDNQMCLKVTKGVWVARHDIHVENR